MKEIALTQGKFAIVDDENYEFLMQFKWYAHKERNTYYACRTPTINGKVIMQYMHQVVMAGKGIDHRDGNGLNNLKSNLRFCTPRENSLNRQSHKDSSCKYKGVYFAKRDKKYIAQLYIDGKTRHLGWFDNEEDAARMVDKWSRVYHGEFARLNFPNE